MIYFGYLRKRDVLDKTDKRDVAILQKKKKFNH